MDLIYLSIVVAFFAVSWGMVRLCVLLGGE